MQTKQLPIMNREAQQRIDQLHQSHQARKAITGLLQATVPSSDTATLVNFQQLGQLLDLLDDYEGDIYSQLEIT